MAQCSFPELDKETKPPSHWRSRNQGTFDTGALKKKSLKRLFNFDRKINYWCASTLTSRRLSVNDYSSGARTSQSALRLQAVLSRRHHDDRQTDRQAEEPQRPTELTSASSGKERERASLEKGQK